MQLTDKLRRHGNVFSHCPCDEEEVKRVVATFIVKRK